MIGVGFLGVSAMSSAGCSAFETDPPPKPESNWTVGDARQFREFSVYWLGESYQGLKLTSMRSTVDGDEFRHASFFYGEPSLAGSPESQSWQPPLEVNIQPYCGFPPEEFEWWAGRYVDSDVSEIQIRGVNGYLERYSSDENSLFLWSDRSTIHVYTWKTDIDIEQAARELLPIAEDTGAELRTLPPPTSTEC
jgi:hypothetical protein